MKNEGNKEVAGVASRLRDARELAGLSQGQVARLKNCHRPTISQIEAGKRRVSADELKEFASLYDVSTSWLLGENDGTLEPGDPRVQLAARELDKLSSDDLDRLLQLIAAMRDTPKTQ